MTDIETTVIDDIKQVAHNGIAAGLGALGAGLVADATGLADAAVTGNWGAAEHLGLALAGAAAGAAWTAARKVLARLFGGSPR